MSIYTENVINKAQDKQNIFKKIVYKHNSNKMINQKDILKEHHLYGMLLKQRRKDTNFNIFTSG